MARGAPYIKAGLGKLEIYALARRLGHEDLADGPAISPSSNASKRIFAELGGDLASERRARSTAEAAELCAATGRPFLGVHVYRRGATFLREPTQ